MHFNFLYWPYGINGGKCIVDSAFATNKFRFLVNCAHPSLVMEKMIVCLDSSLSSLILVNGTIQHFWDGVEIFFNNQMLIFNMISACQRVHGRSKSTRIFVVSVNQQDRMQRLCVFNRKLLITWS